MAPGEPSQPADDPAPNGGPLVPLLRVEQALADPDALATWYAALSSAVSPDVPHQLLALWLYPWDGGAVLVGPEALAQDHLHVPLPDPQVVPAAVAVLEATVRRAGYGSVAAVPIRSGRRDVGLLLAADLAPGRYGDREMLGLELVAERLSPMLGRLARQWGTSAGAGQMARVAALVDVVAFATTEADTPRRFVGELSRALEPLLPHDRLELLLANADGTRAYRLGEQGYDRVGRFGPGSVFRPELFPGLEIPIDDLWR